VQIVIVQIAHRLAQLANALLTRMSAAASWSGAICAVLCAVLALAYVRFSAQPRLATHLLNLPVTVVNELLSESEARGLLDFVRNDIRRFDNIAKDNNFYRMQHEHVGEAVALGSDGKCAHPFLVPSANRTLCVLPGRVDVAQHYVRTGGSEAFKEPYEHAISRLQSFAAYFFDLSRVPQMGPLFNAPTFLAHAKSVCPPDQQHLEPFQVNFILQVPGQTVAIHTDAPYFWGATRFQFPQWLLVAMVHSGLFIDRFVHQVQVVAYVHQWNATNARAGEFVYWRRDASTMERVAPKARAGTIVDGSKMIHAANVYNGAVVGETATPPFIDKSRECALTHIGDDKWELRCDNELLRRYVTDDLRMSVVYRAKCFSSASEAKRFEAQRDEDLLTLEQVLATFRADLEKRGRIHQADQVAPLDLAQLILSEYVRYPLPQAKIHVQLLRGEQS
jgi:hypothetical protein